MAKGKQNDKERARLESAKNDLMERNAHFAQEFDKIETKEQAEELLARLSRPVQFGKSTRPLAEITVKGSNKCRENIAQVNNLIAKLDLSEKGKILAQCTRRAHARIIADFDQFITSCKLLDGGSQFNKKRDVLVEALAIKKNKFGQQERVSANDLYRFMDSSMNEVLKADLPKYNYNLGHKILDAGLWLINKCIELVSGIKDSHTLFSNKHAASQQFETLKNQYCSKAEIPAERKDTILKKLVGLDSLFEHDALQHFSNPK
jgi:hypothetical protein